MREHDIDRFLLRTQKNDVFHMIVKHNLDPNEFEWQVFDDVVLDWGDGKRNLIPDTHVSLRHRGPRNYYFLFAKKVVGSCFISTDDLVDPEGTNVRWLPTETSTFREGEGNADTWKGHFRYLDEWLKTLRREVQQPDLWDLASRQTALASAANDHENAPFSSEELRFIANTLPEVGKTIISDESLPKDQAATILARLDYLVQSSTRVGRKDWYTIVLGALMGLVASRAVEAEVVKLLLARISTDLRPLLEHSVRQLLP